MKLCTFSEDYDITLSSDNLIFLFVSGLVILTSYANFFIDIEEIIQK